LAFSATGLDWGKFDMLAFLEQQRDKLTLLCQSYGVRHLDVFGSAVTGDFDDLSSDLDFIVSFADRSPGTYADKFLNMAEALERLFGRKVDLVTEESIRNPYFRETIEQTRQRLYEQPPRNLKNLDSRFHGNDV
jgi:uncharacterized protein